jgi:hypothetical protein
MKKIIIVLIIFLTKKVSAQEGYVGVIIDKSYFTRIRPYVVYKFTENILLKNINYATIFGMGMNSLGSLSVQFGFDLYKPITKKNRILLGCGIEVLGWIDVYKEYLPTIRFGIESRNTIILITNNYQFNSVFVQGTFGYEPQMLATIGLFYKINSILTYIC